MRVWLISHLALWERLQREEVLCYDPARVPTGLQPFYEWMRQQMAKRLPDYRGQFPWWAWVRWTSEKPMPDLRSWSCELYYVPPEEPMVRLELELPQQEVLCSDFGNWCLVLFNEYVAQQQSELEQWETLPSIQRTRKRLEQSWEAIFDLDQTHWDIEQRRYNPVRTQGVFEYLRLQDVRQITHFHCRYPKRRTSPFSASAGE